MSQAKQQDGGRKSEVLAEFPDPRRNTREVLEAAGENPHPNHHTDADSIRRYFGIAPWDADAYEWPVIPNCLVHTWDAGPDQTAGGTDLFATGAPGSGKSTLANTLAERLIEINGETVVWRGSSSRSEWLPLAPWTTLCLPSNQSVRAVLEPRDKTRDAIVLDVDELDRIVRDVVRYDNPRDLLDNELSTGQFNVVYPDPSLRGCQRLYEESNKRVDDLEFSADDPPAHWWFGFVLARVEGGPHHWMTWIADEIGDLVPQSASKDAYHTYQKIVLLKDLWVDARKHGLSAFLFGHQESDAHDMIRKKLRWRVAMPGGANPTSKSEVVGFGTVPMNSDLTTHMDIGEGLMFTQAHFQQFSWPDFPTPVNYKLKIVI